MQRPETLTLLAFSLVAAGGIAHGWMTHRWSDNPAVTDATVLLQTIPAVVGDWTSEEQQLSKAEVEVGGIAGYVKREYTNAVTGARVQFLLMVGDAGPISLHPPTVCFSGQGYHQFGRLSHFMVRTETRDGTRKSHLLQQADFGNSAVRDPTLTRLYWGWSTDGDWNAPENPRVEYAGAPALFKLYVSEHWIPHGDVQDTGAARLFIRDMLPHISQALQPSAAQENQ